MITTSPVKNTAIGRGRTRQAGCSVNIQSIQAAASPLRPRSMSREVPVVNLAATMNRTRIASSTYGPTVMSGRNRRVRSSSWERGMESLIGALHIGSTPSETI